MENQTLPPIPHLTTAQIKAAADEFRARWSPPDLIPVNIEKIIDSGLGIYIAPEKNLRSVCDIDAYITSDMNTIVIDQQTYENDRMQNRVRFSLAHEIGHYVLHKEAYTSLGITTQEEYYQFTQAKNDQASTFHEVVERQARIFANILLVPREILLERKTSLLKENAQALEKLGLTTDTPGLNDFLAIPLSKEFQVSENVLIIALGYLDSDLKIKTL